MRKKNKELKANKKYKKIKKKNKRAKIAFTIMRKR